MSTLRRTCGKCGHRRHNGTCNVECGPMDIPCHCETYFVETPPVTPNAALARAQKAEAEVERRGKLIERDKTGMASALGEIRTIAKGYGWIPAGELGSYTAAGCGEGEELTEEALRKEVGWCLGKIHDVADVALNESGDRVSATFWPERDRLAHLEKLLVDYYAKGYLTVELHEEAKRIAEARRAGFGK